MVDAVETYAATLREVRRQAAQLASSGDAGTGTGNGGDSSIGSRRGSGTSTPASEASGGSGWVVLESASTPAALPSDTGGCSVWPQAQWQVAYEILFCQCPAAVAALRPHGTDDLLFFVRTDEAAAAVGTRLFVRRRQVKARALPADLAAPPATGAPPTPGVPSPGKAALVDWRASALLMVVLQTAFRLSVVTSNDPEALNAAVDQAEMEGQQGVGGGGSDGGSGGGGAAAQGVRRVSKVVHASPSRVPVNLDNTRSDAGNPQVSYPDICFAVDSCDDAFQSQVLRQQTDCYCVLLHADVALSWSLPASQAATGGTAGAASTYAVAAGMAALSVADTQQPGSSGGGSGKAASRRASSGDGSGRSAASLHAPGQGAGRPAVTLFSGFVSHGQLTAALGGQLAGDPLRKVLRAAAAAARGQPSAGGAGPEQAPLATCRVSMRGPSGKGAADVAVSSYLPPVPAGTGGAEPGSPRGTGSSGAGDGTSASTAAAGGHPGRPNLFHRAQLLARGVAAAAKQAAAGPGSPGGGAGVPIEQLQLRCALMALQVPVELLATSILQAL